MSYADAALLAALPKAPSKYNPYRNLELAKFRRNLVLRNLLENEFLDVKEYEQLKGQNIKLKKKQKVFLEDAQYYIEEVRKKIIDKLVTPRYRFNLSIRLMKES